MRKLFRKLNDKVIELYCRAQAARGVVVGLAQGESGMSKLAITLILLAVGVSLTLAVIAIIAPELLGLAEKVGEDIKSVPLDDW
jgi:hypothetical protein